MAIACYNKYLELNPNASDKKDVQAKIHKIETNKEFSADEYNIKGVNAHNERRYEQAIEYYNQAISINPNYATAYYNLGNVYVSLGGSVINDDRLSKAFVYYKKAIDINPDYVNAYRGLGFVYGCLGNIDMALDCYKKHISLKSYDAITCYNLGNENYGSLIAVAYFQKAVSIDPVLINAYALDALGRFYSKMGGYTPISGVNAGINIVPKIYEAISCYDYAASLASKDKKKIKNFVSSMGVT